jgi:glutamate carboxypeptidase
MDLHQLGQTITTNEPRLLARLRQLVEIESPSDDKAAVDRANNLVASWAKDLGATIKRHKQRTHGDILELRFGPTRGPRTLVLGHLDTVWPIGTLAKMPWREAEGKIFGPGTVDMKAGVVMALEAIATLNNSVPITLLLVSDEEIGSPISRPLTERIAKTCAAVFVLEPPQGLAYKTARKGVGHFELRVEGIASHAGVDFTQGHSAVLEMARLIEQIAAFTNLAQGITVNAGVIRGGTKSNVVAAECTAEIDVRIVRASQAKAIETKIRKLRLTDKACKLTITGGFNRPPMERKPGTVALFRKAQTIAKQMGFHLEEASTGGGSDGNFTAALGIPTLDGMGAVGAGAHASSEHIVRAHILERTTLLAAMLRTDE